MKKLKLLPAFVKIGFIINFLCLVAFLFERKANDLKGIEAWICALSLLGFSSFFALLVIFKNLRDKKQSMFFLILGLAYILMASILINTHYLQNQDVSVFIICVSVILALPFIIALLFLNNQKTVKLCIYITLVMSWLLSFLPVITVINIPIGIVFAIFNKNVPFPWQN